MCFPFVGARTIQAEHTKIVGRKSSKTTRKPNQRESKEFFPETRVPCEHDQYKVTCVKCKASLRLAVSTYSSGATYSCSTPESSEIFPSAPRTRHEDRKGSERPRPYRPVYRTELMAPSKGSTRSLDSMYYNGSDRLPLRPLQPKNTNTSLRSSSKAHRASRPTLSHHPSIPNDDIKENSETHDRVNFRVASPSPDRSRRPRPREAGSEPTLGELSQGPKQRFPHTKIRFQDNISSSTSTYGHRSHSDWELIRLYRDRDRRDHRMSDCWEVSPSPPPRAVEKSVVRYRYPKIESISDEDW